MLTLFNLFFYLLSAIEFKILYMQALDKHLAINFKKCRQCSVRIIKTATEKQRGKRHRMFGSHFTDVVGMNIRQPIKFCVTNVNLMTEYTRNESFLPYLDLGTGVLKFRYLSTWN